MLYLRQPVEPIIIVSQQAEQKMRLLIDMCSDEIGWHGLVDHKQGTNTYYIYDILVYPQTVTGTTITPDQKEFEKWIDTFRWDLESTAFEDLRMHGHSHVNMGVFASGVDSKFQEDLVKNLKKDDFYIFLIRNKKEDMFIKIYDTENEVIWETEDVTYEVETPEELKLWAQDEIEQYVKRPKQINSIWMSPQLDTLVESEFYKEFINKGGTYGLK